MGIKSIAKRAEYGNRLLRLEQQGTDAITRLQELTQTLPMLMTNISEDEDLSQEEKDDALAEVNVVIASLVTQVKAFAGGL